VGRADSGQRRYSDDDLAWIGFLQRPHATGMPIRTIRRYAELVRAGDRNELERLALLRTSPLRSHRSRCSTNKSESGETRSLDA
jgi:DNA-binding transcriptional MerR regulator